MRLRFPLIPQESPKFVAGARARGGTGAEVKVFFFFFFKSLIKSQDKNNVSLIKPLFICWYINITHL